MPPRSVTANTRPFNLTDSTNLDLQGQAKGGMGTNTFNYVYGANGDGRRPPAHSAEPADRRVTGTDVQAVMGVTPANGAGVAATPNTDGSIASSHDGFTPGDESLRMAELLRQKQHGDALMSMRKVYQERTTPMQGRYGAPPVMQAFTPSRTITMGGANFMQFGTAGTPGGDAQSFVWYPGWKHGHDAARTSDVVAADPRRAHELETDRFGNVLLRVRDLLHGGEKLGSTILHRHGRLGAAPPGDESGGAETVLLDRALIEALEGFHEQLNVRMNALTTETEKLRSTVEATQPRCCATPLRRSGARQRASTCG